MAIRRSVVEAMCRYYSFIINFVQSSYQKFRCCNSPWLTYPFLQMLQCINRTTSLPFSELVMPSLHPDSVDICTRLLCINPGLSLAVLHLASTNILKLWMLYSLTCRRLLLVKRMSWQEFINHNFLRP